MQDIHTIDCYGLTTIHSQGYERLKGCTWGAALCVLPVRKSVERNEAAHLGVLNPT